MLFSNARLDEFIARVVDRWLRRRGWRETVIPYPSYGNQRRFRLLARVVRTADGDLGSLGWYARKWLTRRGWRNFFAAPVPDAEVTISIGSRTVHTRSDSGGFVDLFIDEEQLPDWHSYQVRTNSSEPVEAWVQIIADDQHYGIISDIDDTIIKSFLPRMVLATWNSVFSTEGARQAVPGMARMYQRFMNAHPGAPIIYVSTGTWSSQGFLRRFMRRHGLPRGPVLLADWGMLSTGYFRTGRQHKRRSFAELIRDLPQVSWLLIGDNGQHDPVLYRELAELHPNNVRGILIRRLSATEQVLTHGASGELPGTVEVGRHAAPVPEASGADGDDLYYWMCAMLGEEPAPLRKRQR